MWLCGSTYKRETGPVMPPPSSRRAARFACHPGIARAALLVTLLAASASAQGCAPPYNPAGTYDLRVAPGEARAFPSGLQIAPGQRVLIEGAVTIGGGLNISGTLYLSSTSNSNITADWVAVASGGALIAGSEACPVPASVRATIALRNGVAHPAAGYKALAVLAGGTLELHGAKGLDASWARLSATAPAGASSLTLDAPSLASWGPGDEVAIASTDFDPYQTERVRIASVAGSVVTLSSPLKFKHFGAVTLGVDERAEVRAWGR